jgi:hypothetical protein
MKTTQTNRQKSKQSEKQLARQLSGRIQPSSGSLPVKNLKLDVLTENFAIDDKATLKKSFGIKLEDWRKTRKQSFGLHRRPAMSINFTEEKVRLFVIDEQTFMELDQIMV